MSVFMVEWANKLWCIHISEYYSGVMVKPEGAPELPGEMIKTDTWAPLQEVLIL